MLLVLKTHEVSEMQSDKLFPTGHRGRGGLWLISDRELGPPAGPARNTWLHWLPGLISGHQVGVSLWADNPMRMNCCHCARRVTSCAHASPFLGAIFLSLHLLVLMSGRPVSPGRQPRDQCPRQSLSAFAFWLWWPCAIGWHLRAQKGKMAPFTERAPQASPLESLSTSLFSACRHFRLGGGHGPHPGFLGSVR